MPLMKILTGKLKSGNGYHMMQNLLSSSLLSKNVQTKIHRTVILRVVLNGHETWSLTLRDECVEDVREWGSEKTIWAKEE